MKENVIDVLRYLFEQYMDVDSEPHPDRASLHSDLCDAGFSHREIHKALKWLEGLTERRDAAPMVANMGAAMRIYTDKEMDRIHVQGRGLLLFLEQCGILDLDTRELVIDRVMALEAQDIDLEELKWVVLMVLLNLPQSEESYARMEDLIFDGYGADLH